MKTRIIIAVGCMMLLFSCTALKKFSDDLKRERERQESEKQQQQQPKIVATAQIEPPKNKEIPVSKVSKTITPLRNKELSPNEIADCVTLHNNARKEVGVPPVEWSNELANIAQEWAEKIAQEGILSHRANNIYGENCAMLSGKVNLAQAIPLWYGEKKNYRGGVINENNWSNAGHYTQMVWRNSTQIGMGKAMNSRGQTFIVANYNPAGNRIGEKAY